MVVPSWSRALVLRCKKRVEGRSKTVIATGQSEAEAAARPLPKHVTSAASPSTLSANTAISPYTSLCLLQQMSGVYCEPAQMGTGDHACHPPKGVVSTRRRTHTSKHPTALLPPPRIIDHYSSTMMGSRELRRWCIGLDLLSRNSKGDGLGATGCRLSARLEPNDTQRTLEFLFDFLQPCSSRMYYIQPSYVTNH